MSELAGLIPGINVPGAVAGKAAHAATATGRSAVRTVRLAAVMAVLLLAALVFADVQATGAQVAADCGKVAGSFPVPVPKTHIPVIGWLTGALDDPTRLRDVMAGSHPDVALTTVVAANPDEHMTPMGDVPATSGGVACLLLPAKGKGVASPGKAPAP